MSDATSLLAGFLLGHLGRQFSGIPSNSVDCAIAGVL
ncbi:hypothetical protein EMEDMD4_520086 [Sinorhizobium medicae]|uniref:Uncharacterized protein n=1 Tax=Sinorhizobium medicae TaxID=110321 RepID=A0A508X1R5_9HYPH|nr:hypothetical protein EMEDMD4_520086 [Sinorhizobium medicae]